MPKTFNRLCISSFFCNFRSSWGNDS